MRAIPRKPIQLNFLVPALFHLATACSNPPPAFHEVTTPVEESPTAQSEPGKSIELDPEKNDHTPADRGESEPDSTGVMTARWKFRSTTQGQGQFELRLDSGAREQRFKMEPNRLHSQLEFQQLSRARITESFSQGSDIKQHSESFRQNAGASGPLDVLVVVDNSASMQEEQTNLSRKLQPLLSFVGGSDWQIAVTTTDPGNGCLRGLIKKGDSNIEQQFISAISAGTSGSGNERGILQAVRSLKGDCGASEAWLRKNSTVAILIVSDEDNCSLGGQECAGQAWAKADYLVAYLESIRTPGVNARTYGLIWHPNQAQASCGSALAQASIYAEAIDRTGGSYGSICDADYSRTLKSISLDLSNMLQRQFTLKYPATAQSLRVFIDDQQVNSGFKLTGKVIEFAQAPTPGAKIRIAYQSEQKIPQQEFPLAHAADAATVEVYLDGVMSRDFEYDAAAQTVRFATIPTAADVRLSYRRDGELPSSFAIAKDLDPASLTAEVNGVVAKVASYEAESGMLRLSSAPSDGAMVQIFFNRILGPKLRYPLFDKAERIENLTVYDANSGQAIDFIREGEDLIFAEEQYAAGRQIQVFYRSSAPPDKRVELGRVVLADGIRVQGSLSGLCASPKLESGLDALDLSSCQLSAGETLRIAFKYTAEHRQSFLLGSMTGLGRGYRFQVWVNGQASRNFHIAADVLSFDQLPLNSVIDVALFRN